MPASVYNLLILVDLIHPVAFRQVSFKALSTFWQWVNCDQTELAYSGRENLRANAVVQILVGFAPYEADVSSRVLLVIVKCQRPVEG